MSHILLVAKLDMLGEYKRPRFLGRLDHLLMEFLILIGTAPSNRLLDAEIAFLTPLPLQRSHSSFRIL